ncbi:hypothetical protein DRO45_00065 [Candidatus Bathyarchaeota archaeon]|nr:MAG: hypothetical protein DRO45_00065 [Candidatus Bathyarchaeota archaeon]
MSLALILSLVFALVVFVPVIMVVGVTEPLQDLISASPTAAAMNTTAWNTIGSVFSGFSLITMMLIVGAGVLLLIMVATSKAFKE